MTLSLIALAMLAPTEGRIIVQLKPGANPATVASRANVVLRDVTPNAPFALYGVPSGTVDAAQVRLQADVKNVAWAEDDQNLGTPEETGLKAERSKGSSLGVVGDRFALVQKNVNILNQVGWSSSLATSDGRTVRLAILDTGISRRQTALWAKVDATFDAFGGNGDDAPMGADSNGNGIKDEGIGHGTMVAGIVDQVAPKVRLVVAKVADGDGRSSAWNIVEGLAFAANQGAEIANVSLGSAEAVAAFNDAAEWAESKGVLVVSAIGNTGTDRSWFPARSSKALCVVGLNADDSKAAFSNWDSAADASAPAVGIVSQWWDGSLGVWSGTSFASPFVAGGLADCLRRTTKQAPRSLIRTTTDSGINVDGLNKKYKGKIGTALDIVSLDRKLRPKP